MTFNELLKENTSWKRIIIMDYPRMKIIDDFDLYGTRFENFVEDYKDTVVKSYKFDGTELTVHFDYKDQHVF